MPIDINGLSIAGGTSVVATDTATNNLIYQQTSAGLILSPQTSAGGNMVAYFNVGYAGNAWVNFTANQWNVIPFAYTSGSGYYNVNGCYNTSTYRFTAPLTGLYLLKFHVYHYYPDTNLNRYVHPGFYVNGSLTDRRGGMHPYKIRNYGIRGDYGNDSDMCEHIYLTAGDYVQAAMYVGNAMQVLPEYCTFNGSYLGS